MATVGVSTQVDGLREKVVTISVDGDDPADTATPITFMGAAPGGCAATTDLIATPTDYGSTITNGQDNHVALDFTISAITAAGFTITKHSVDLVGAHPYVIRAWFRCPRGVAR